MFSLDGYTIFSFFVPFMSIFIIMDPFASIPPFLAFTSKCKEKEMMHTANRAVLLAGILALIFLFFGTPLLDSIHITISDFRVAGGIVLVLMGLQNVLDISFSNHKDKDHTSLDAAAVLIATPLLAGPGLMSGLIVLELEFGLVPVLVSLFAALFVSWLLLASSHRIRRAFGTRIIIIGSKVIGLLLIAIGISYIKIGMAV